MAGAGMIEGVVEQAAVVGDRTGNWSEDPGTKNAGVAAGVGRST